MQSAKSQLRITHSNTYSRKEITRVIREGTKIMSKLFEAMSTRDTFTENDMIAHSTTGKALVDLFFRVGASRARTDGDILRDFVAAYGENSLAALKTMFYNRDIRAGQGERRTFKIMFRWLCFTYPQTAINNLHNVPFFGRWDDLLQATDTPVEEEAFNFIADALRDRDALCAKWMPRENKAGAYFARKLRNHMGLSPRSYRKLLSGITSVVETQMCDDEWDNIDYSRVPSKAINIYRNAFQRHDPEGYGAWVAELQKPEAERIAGTKINAGAIYPHEIVTKLNSLMGVRGGRKVDDTTNKMLEAQWSALPDYVPKGKRILPVCDVSGSMWGLPMDVCISLGLYLAERNEGLFHNQLITFSHMPSVHTLRSSSLSDRVIEISNMDWGMNTDITAVFNLILKSARRAELSADEMPEAILILSDMQFDKCADRADSTAMEMIERKYHEAGYGRPTVVFWNLRATDNVPARFNEAGVLLVSGFSPSIMKSVLSGHAVDPLSMVLVTINNERYDRVVV